MHLRHALLCTVGICWLTLPIQTLAKGAPIENEKRPLSSWYSRPALDATPLRTALGLANPGVLYNLTNRTVTAGKTVAFRCRAYGSPKPRIKWKKNGVTVTQSYRIRIRHMDSGSRLRIKHAQLSDAGFYQCMAKNNHGVKLSEKVYLSVKGTRKPGKNRCEPYAGTLCKFHTFVHIPSGRAQNQIERSLGQTHRTLVNTHALSARCRKHLLPIMCRLNYPACSARRISPPRRVCREVCVSIERRWCRKEMKKSRAFRMLWRRFVSCGALPAGGKNSNCAKVFAKGKTKIMSLQSNPPTICIRYTGTLCKPYLKTGQLVALRGRNTQQSSEAGLMRALGRLDGYISPKCGQYLRKALCYHLFPPCTAGARLSPTHICKTHCEVLKGRVCSKEFRYLSLFPEDSEFLPSCDRLPTSKIQSGEPCMNLGFRGNESKSPSESNAGFDRCSQFLKGVRKNSIAYPVISPISNKSYSCGNSSLIFTSASKVRLPSQVLGVLGSIKINVLQGLVASSQSNETAVRYCIRTNFNLGNLVQGWSAYRKSVPLPYTARPSLSTSLSGLEVVVADLNETAVLVPLGSAASYQAHGKILLQDVRFYYRQNFINSSASSGSFIARGSYQLCETVFQAEVERDKKGTVRMTGTATSPLDVNTIERVFGLAIPSNMLFKTIKRSELLVLRLMNPSFEAFVDKHVSIKFSGHSYMYIGWDARPAYLEFYAGKHHRTNLFIAGLTSEELTFNEALETFTGLNLPYLDFIEGFTKSSIGVLISTSAIQASSHPRIHLDSEPLSTTTSGSIPRGLTIVLRNQLPRACSGGSRLCQLLLVVFGEGSRFTTSISANQDRVTINILLDKTSHDALVTYETAEITLKVPYENMSTLLDVLPYLTFNVRGNVRVSNGKRKKLHFDGQLDYDGIMSKLHGKFTSLEEWRDAFGVKDLTIKKLTVRLSIPTDTMNDQITNRASTDGVFEFGAGCHRKGLARKTGCISGYGHVGFSEDITEHYFYGSVRSLTLQQLLRACNMDVQLPAPLATIGFPRGLTISVAKIQHDLRPDGGPLVSSGLVLKGRLNVLGVETDATVHLSPREFLIDSDISGDESIRVDDATPLQLTGRKYGPKLFLKTRIDPTPYLKAHIDGYARIFGVFDEIRVLVTPEVSQIHMVANLHKTIKAYLYMTSNYSRHINTTHLQAKIIFHNGLSKLTRLASKHVVVMLEKEKSQLKNAEGEAQRKSKACQRTAKRECMACFGRKHCRSVVSTCAKERAQSSGRSLQSVCQQALYDDCHGYNGTCRQICNVMGLKLNTSCKAYRDATKTLYELERSLKWVQQAQMFISGTFFQIHGISFEANASLQELMKVFVDTTFDCTVFGQRHRLKGLKLRLDAFTHLASEIAKYAVKWYGKNHAKNIRYQGNRP